MMTGRYVPRYDQRSDVEFTTILLLYIISTPSIDLILLAFLGQINTLYISSWYQYVKRIFIRPFAHSSLFGVITGDGEASCVADRRTHTCE